MNRVLWIVEHLLDEQRADSPDRRLLERFARDRDEVAFAELVRRHGPMVLGVCRRVLGNDADADDAFQAVFLVLARKAGSVSNPDQLSQWLHGVAYNASRKLRQAIARRTAREQAAAVPAEVQTTDLALADEWFAVLDEELTRLPEHYRAVVVLCDLEGRTRREAAAELGWPEGTVAGRLARARERLANLLGARGYAPAVGVLVTAPMISSATVAAVARAVTVYGIAGATGGPISPRAELTAQGVIQAMVAKKLQPVVAGLCIGLALLAAVGGIHSANAQPGPGKADSVDKPRVPERPKPAEEKVLSVIPLKKLDARPTADKLLELLPKSVTVAAARDENALLVYATARGTDDVRLVLRTLGEDTQKGLTGAAWDADGPPLRFLDPKHPDWEQPQFKYPLAPLRLSDALKRVTPKTFTDISLSANWDKVFETYARLSGLEYKGTIKIDGTFTYDDPRFTLDQFTDAINHELLRKNLLLVRGPKTFTVSRPEDIDWRSLPAPDLKDLDTFAGTDLVRVIIPVKRTKAQHVVSMARLFGTPFVTAEASPSGNGVTVRDLASKIRALLKAARDADAVIQMPEPVKTYGVRFEKTPWKDVFAWYEQASGLKRKGYDLPPGTFTLNRLGPNPGEKPDPLTLSEVSDAINDALFQQNWLLIPGQDHFRVHPADEVVPGEYYRRVTLAEASGYRRDERYQLREVEVPIPVDGKADAGTVASGLRPILSSFGKVEVTRDRRIILGDVAVNLRSMLVRDLPPDSQPGGRGGAPTGGPGGLPGGTGAATLQEREKAAMAAMAGTWELQKTLVDGKEEENAFEYWRWHFDGRAVRSEYKTRDGREHTSDLTVTVNPTADPPEMNVHGKATLLLAIYRQDGDRMTVAILGRSEVERPRGFDPKDKRVRDVPLIVWEFRRQATGSADLGGPAVSTGGGDSLKPRGVKFYKMPWKDVFAWYEKAFGLKLKSTDQPDGTFTYASEVPLSLATATDAINDALVKQKWLLVPRQMTFVVIGADDKIDPVFVTTLRDSDELPQRRRHELVKVILSSHGAKNALATAKPLLGPFGSVTQTHSGAVIVQDTAANAIKIEKALDALAAEKVEHTGMLTDVVLTQSATDKTQRVESAAVRVKDQVFQLDVSESLAARQELIRRYGDQFRSTAVADPQVTVKGRLEYRLATTVNKGEREAALVPVIVVESLQILDRPFDLPGAMPGGGGRGEPIPGATPGGGPSGSRPRQPAGGGAGTGSPPRPRTQEERDQEQDIEEKVAGLVKSLGGSVQRDERLPGKPVVQVSLYRGPVTDDNLKTLAAFTQLRELELMDTSVTDAGMKHVATMANLQTLNIQGTKVTDEGLKHLRPLKKISQIDLCRTAVTDAGVRHLLDHPGLTHLYLWGTAVTDVGVKELVKLTGLNRLELGSAKVTDDGVKELASLRALTVLGLQLTGVTDKGMKSLAPLTKLTRLDLHNTALTDAGLKDLAALPALADLRVAGCKLSADGIAAFQKAKPECAIEAEIPKKETSRWTRQRQFGG